MGAEHASADAEARAGVEAIVFACENNALGVMEMEPARE